MQVEQGSNASYWPRRMDPTPPRPDFTEFAKRYFFREEKGWVECSPFPVSRVADRPGITSLVVASIRGEGKKGTFAIRGVPAAVEALGRLRGVRPDLIRKSVMVAFQCTLATYLLRRRVRAPEAACLLVDAFRLPEGVKVIPEKDLVNCFQDSLRSKVISIQGVSARAREDALDDLEDVSSEETGYDLRSVDPLLTVFHNVNHQLANNFVEAVMGRGLDAESLRAIARGLTMVKDPRSLAVTDLDRETISGGRLVRAFLKALAADYLPKGHLLKKRVALRAEDLQQGLLKVLRPVGSTSHQEKWFLSLNQEPLPR